MPRDLAAWMSPAATSRTWETLPADPSTSSLATVCTESTMSNSGRIASMWASTWARSVSAARYSDGSRARMRSARSRTCPADSSPLT